MSYETRTIYTIQYYIRLPFINYYLSPQIKIEIPPTCFQRASSPYPSFIPAGRFASSCKQMHGFHKRCARESVVANAKKVVYTIFPVNKFNDFNDVYCFYLSFNAWYFARSL